MDNLACVIDRCDRVLVDVVRLGFFTNVESDLFALFIDFDADQLNCVDKLPLLIVSVLNEEAIAVFDKVTTDSENLVVEVVNVRPVA